MTNIFLYNSASRTKEEFIPIDKDNVRMYVCGPTLYDKLHIGNARPLVVFDVLYRLLKQEYGEDSVTYVRNITDIDDKIFQRATEREISYKELVAENESYFKANLNDLKCLPTTFEPKASSHIKEMVNMISILLKKGYAYKADDGNILFDTSKYANYGKLSNKPIEDNIAGLRVAVEGYKKNPEDFILWKPSKSGEAEFEAPFGSGRPGWHIECSAMAKEFLGDKFDIHGGGMDLFFPHHENENAQSCCTVDETSSIANYWVHNAFINLDGKKMSKSLGNFKTIDDIISSYSGEILRLALLMTHHSKPLDITNARLEEARNILYNFIDIEANAPSDYKNKLKKAAEEVTPELRKLPSVSNEVIDYLKDDLNTPMAIKFIQEQLHSFNKEVDLDKKLELHELIRKNLHFLGFHYLSRTEDSTTFIEYHGLTLEEELTIVEKERELAILERKKAKRARDFGLADKLREEIEEKYNIILIDQSDGTTTWKPKV